MGIIDKIQSAKETVERKTKAKKADKRAKQRRIEQREPGNIFEKSVVAGKEAKELGGAVKEFGSEATPDSDGTVGNVAGNIGQGAESVVDDADSGSLDPFADSDMDGDLDPFETDSSGSFDDDLDMDLDDIP